MSNLITTETVPLVTGPDGIQRVGKTRVTLDTIVTAFTEGATAEEIVQQYPSLLLADVYTIIGYYLRRRADVDAYLSERQLRAAQVQSQNEARWNPVGIRERLVARQTGRQP